MDRRTRCPARLANHVTERRTKWIRHAHMRDEFAAKETAPTLVLGIVKQLIGNNDVTGCKLHFQRAAGAYPDHRLDTQRFQRIDIGAVRHFTRSQDVTAPVSRHKRDLLTAQVADDNRVTGWAERSVDAMFGGIGEFWHMVEAGASDHCNANDFDLLSYQCPLEK